MHAVKIPRKAHRDPSYFRERRAAATHLSLANLGGGCGLIAAWYWRMTSLRVLCDRLTSSGAPTTMYCARTPNGNPSARPGYASAP